MLPVLIFVLSYVALSLGRVPGLRSDRLGVVVIGATLMIGAGGLSLTEAQASIDGATIALLFGMMVISAALELSGAFALAGSWITRRSLGPTSLLTAVCLVSAVASALFINDVVCLALTPVVVRLTAELDCDPKPYLIGFATASNIGSAATLTGNPQNILIGSLSGLSYLELTAALAPIAALSLVANVVVLRLVFRASLARPFGPRAPGKAPRVYQRWLYKGGLVSAAVLVAFVAGASPPIAALAGASAILLTRAVHPRRVYARVDWSLLALFAGLFVIVAGVERVGLGERVVAALAFARPDHAGGLTLLTAIVSNLVSNVPAVMVLKSIVPHLPDPRRAWLTLSMASTLAGNVTLPGSLATMIVVERAKEHVHISFGDFLKVGLPTALVSLAIGAAWLEWIAG